MRTIEVTFNNGETLTTSINGTDAEIIAHYVGVVFTDEDDYGRETKKVGKAVKFLNEAVAEVTDEEKEYLRTLLQGEVKLQTNALLQWGHYIAVRRDVSRLLALAQSLLNKMD